jgi:hypothetical protein
MRLEIVIVLLAFLTGCAGITVTPLDKDGKKLKDTQEGLVFYRPKPYILVAKLPATITPTKDSKQQEKIAAPQSTKSAAPASKKKGAPPPPDTSTDNKAGDGKSEDGDTGTTPPVVSGDTTTSFSVSSNGYLFKLIYLPDYSKPYALNANSGLIGTATLKPTLQDGWMLTSLDGSGDNKVAETLTAVASIVSSALGGGGGATKAASTSTGKSSTAGFLPGLPLEAPYVAAENNILAPGLYDIHYNATGIIDSLVMVSRFCDKGVVAANEKCQ